MQREVKIDTQVDRVYAFPSQNRLLLPSGCAPAFSVLMHTSCPRWLPQAHALSLQERPSTVALRAAVPAFSVAMKVI